jgi:hypothetical protein
MGFWRQISPRRAVNDFANEWRQPNPYRWRVLGVSVAATFALMMLLLPESERIKPQPPDVTWISTFAEGRTDAEIVASNIENQKRKDKLAAEAAERAERRREAYKALGRATGVDVEAMEEEIERERAAEEAAATPQARTAVAQ